jgi:hypothetical protein
LLSSVIVVTDDARIKNLLAIPLQGLHAQVGFVTARSTFRCGCVTVDPWVIHRGGNLMSLQSHLSELAAKHKALESELQDALSHPSSSDQEIAELKRKKLKLKDEMIRLESQLSRH